MKFKIISQKSLKNDLELMQQIFDLNNDGILILEGGKIRLTNLKFKTLTGHSIDNLEDLPISRLITEFDQKIIEKQIEQVLSDKQKYTKYDTKIITNDGSENHVELTINAINQDNRQYAVVSIRNTKDRARLFDQLHSKIEELEELTNALGTFIQDPLNNTICIAIQTNGYLESEINSIIKQFTSLKMAYLALLTSNSNSFENDSSSSATEIMSSFDEVIKQAENALKFFNTSSEKLMVLSKGINAYLKSQYPQETSPIQLGSILHSIFARKEIQGYNTTPFKIPEKITLEFFHNGNLCYDYYILPEVLANGKAIQIAIEETIKNSVEEIIGGSKTGVITINFTIQDNSLILSVQDKGRGVTPKNLSKITCAFDKILGSKQSTSLGLGGFLAKSFIVNSGGKYAITSISEKTDPNNHGTTVTMTIPLAKTNPLLPLS